MMVENKSARYLVYVDILGFEELAKEIAEKTDFCEDLVRENFLSNPLIDKIKYVLKKECMI